MDDDAKLDMRLALTAAKVEFDAARDRRDACIGAAAKAGMSLREIGGAVGLSFQRVSQVINEEASHGS